MWRLWISIMMGLALIAAQLPDDQALLLAEVESAFVGRDTWQQYSQRTQYEITRATTLTTADAATWDTQSAIIDMVVETDRAEDTHQGTVTRTDTRSSASDETRINSATLNFEITGETIRAGEAEGALSDITEDTETLDTFRLGSVLIDEGHVPIALLQHVDAVFDLGVERESNLSRVQGYQLALDIAGSLPLIGFNIDAFAQDYNGVVELRALTDAIIDNATLTLYVYVDAQSQQLRATTLILNINLEIAGESVVAAEDGNGVFSLVYTDQQQTQYFAINQASDN